MTNSFDVLQRGAAESGIVLGERALGQFERYFDLLMDWNTRVNLTSVTARAEVESRHFLDSLAVARAVPVEALASARIADVGSGAGFPGMPLAIVFPGSSVTLMEATSKKTRFLSALIESLELSNVTVLAGRAEELAHREDLRESFDLVLARAVAGLRSLAELTLPFCSVGGRVVVHKGPDAAGEVLSATRAIETLGGGAAETISIPSLHTSLVVIPKRTATPVTYPRRAGIPEKRPL